jgi:hypothetical protein
MAAGGIGQGGKGELSESVFIALYFYQLLSYWYMAFPWMSRGNGIVGHFAVFPLGGQGRCHGSFHSSVNVSVVPKVTCPMQGL